MKNKARRSAFLALAEDMFVHPEFTCIKMEFPKSRPLLSGFGNMELELKFFIDHIKPENAAVVESIPSNHGGWWQTNTDGTPIGFGYECRIFALLLCAEMLRRPEKKKLKEVINIDPEEVFRDTSKVPEGWKIVPHNQRIKAGDRFKLDTLRWSITNQPGDKQQHRDLVYIRKIAAKKVFTIDDEESSWTFNPPGIPDGWTRLAPTIFVKEGDMIWIGRSWTEATMQDIGKPAKFGLSDKGMVAIRKIATISDKTEKWQYHPDSIPVGWYRVYEPEVRKVDDLYWAGYSWVPVIDVGSPAYSYLDVIRKN